MTAGCAAASTPPNFLPGSRLVRSVERELRSYEVEDPPLPPLQIGGCTIESNVLPGDRLFRLTTRCGAETRILFDPNVLLERWPEGEFGAIRISPSGRKAAIGFDRSGTGAFELMIAGDPMNPQIPRLVEQGVFDFDWGADDSDLYLTKKENLRASSLFRLELDPPVRTHLLRPRDDGASLVLKRSVFGTHLLVIEHRTTSSPHHYVVDFRFPEKLHPIRKTQGALAYTPFVSADGVGTLEIHGARTILRQASSIPIDVTTSVHDVEATPGCLALWSREPNRDRISFVVDGRIVEPSDYESKSPRKGIKLPPAAQKPGKYTVKYSGVTLAPEFRTYDCRTGAISTVSAATPIEVRQLLERLETGETQVRSTDGTDIPVTYARLRTHKGPSAAVVTVYGAYGTALRADFDPQQLVLLERGVVLIWAHVRGGGERGAIWHRSGSGVQKQQAVLDLVAVARGLVEQGIAAEGRLAVSGSSAGGAVALSAIMHDPGAFRAGVLRAPFLELRQAAQDDARERGEWGIRFIEAFDALPLRWKVPVLVLHGASDSIVPVEATRRWIAKLPRDPGEESPVHLVEFRGGHDGPADRVEERNVATLSSAFFLNQILE